MKLIPVEFPWSLNPKMWNTNAIRAVAAKRHTLWVVPFYGAKSGNLAYLSQHYLTNFKNKEGISFCCAEQYMMWRKATIFNDSAIANRILLTADPVEMKHLGRQVHNFDTKVWDKISQQIVFEGNILKFLQNEEIYSNLLKLRGSILAEATPRDRIWGVGCGKAEASNPMNWRGENRLGFTLMQVQSVLFTQALARLHQVPPEEIDIKYKEI